MNVAADEDRRQLEEIDEKIGGWIAALLDRVAQRPDVIDDEYLEAWLQTSKKLALRLSTNPPSILDDAAIAKLRGIVLEGIQVNERRAEQPILDLVDDAVVRAERVRHVFRDALDEDIGVDAGDAAAVVGRLRTWLDGVPLKDVADLLAISPRHVTRLGFGESRASRRLRMVVQMVALLRRSWTPEGVIAWFYRPRRELSDRRPIDVLDDADYERELLALVRRGRAQYGS